MAPDTSFKVVIAGAGIAGLALVNMLEKHDIDYVVLEKHSSVICEVGASIGLFPHGLRILDQLGLYDDITEFLDGQTGIGQTNIRRADGSVLKKLGDITEHMIRRYAQAFRFLQDAFNVVSDLSSHGYPFLFFDRQDLLRILHNKIQHKERIHVGKAVSDVTLIPGGVRAACLDGSTYSGTILVGADGVHSSVRGAMRQLAAKLEPGYFDSNEESMTPSYYRCSFGIAQHVPRWPKGGQQMVHGDQRSQLLVPGPDDKVYWFLFERLPEPKRGPDIPKFGKEDEEEFFRRYRDLPVTENISFGDVVKNRVSSALTPLHEVVYKKWHFQRIITIGDSAHKVSQSLSSLHTSHFVVNSK